MKKYFIMGEDMPKKEVSREEAQLFLFDSDYHVIVEDEENEDAENVKSSFSEKPSWKPFEFPERSGYKVSGYTIIKYDSMEYRGNTIVPYIPEGAEKTDVQNVWKLVDKIYQAVPKYEILPTDGCGECAKCIRYQCSRRKSGIKCRNYKDS